MHVNQRIRGILVCCFPHSTHKCFFWARNLRPLKLRKHQVPGGLEWNVWERLLVRTEIPRSLRGKEIPLGYLWWLGTKMKDVYPRSKGAKNSDTFSDVWRGEANTSPNKTSRDLETLNCSPFIVQSLGKCWDSKLFHLFYLSSAAVLNKKTRDISKNVKVWTNIFFCHSESIAEDQEMFPSPMLCSTQRYFPYEFDHIKKKKKKLLSEI